MVITKNWNIKLNYHNCPYHTNKKGIITRYICNHFENESDKCTIIDCPININ